MRSIGIASPSSFLSNTVSLESAEESPQVFRLGEVLEGEMIEWIDDHHAVIQFKGKDHLVKSQFTLPRDLEGPFRVEATRPQLILRIMSEEARGGSPAGTRLKNQYLPDEMGDASIEDLSRTLSNLGGISTEAFPAPVQDTLKHLLALLERFSISSSCSPDLSQMEEAVLRSGLFLEERLKRLVDSHLKDQGGSLIEGDLKGLLIKLKSQWGTLSSLGGVPTVPSRLVDETARGIDRILRKIEGYQSLNLPSPDSGGKVFLLLPLWVQGHLRFVEMALSLPRRHPGGREREGVSILCLLELPHLGKLSIEVKVKEKALYCCFSVCDREVSGILGRHFPELQARLVCLGFEPQLSLATESPEKMTRTFFEEIGQARDSLLDRVV